MSNSSESLPSERMGVMARGRPPSRMELACTESAAPGDSRRLLGGPEKKLPSLSRGSGFSILQVGQSVHVCCIVVGDNIAKINFFLRGRNNLSISSSQQDYLVGKSGSPQIYLVVIWPRFKQNNMTNKNI